MLHVIKPRVGTEAQIHAFLNSLVDRGECSASRSDGFTPSERIVQVVVQSLKIGKSYPRILEIGVGGGGYRKFDVIGMEFPVIINCKWKNTWHCDKFILVKNSTCFGQTYCPSSAVFQHCTHSNRYLSCYLYWLSVSEVRMELLLCIQCSDS
jgi:hypothetical protein